MGLNALTPVTFSSDSYLLVVIAACWCCEPRCRAGSHTPPPQPRLHRDEMWRTLRKAWQPVFSSSSLAGYMALMDQVQGSEAWLVGIGNKRRGQLSGRPTA